MVGGVFFLGCFVEAAEVADEDDDDEEEEEEDVAEEAGAFNLPHFIVRIFDNVCPFISTGSGTCE